MKTTFRQLKNELRINTIKLTDAELLRLLLMIKSAPEDLDLSQQVIRAQLIELLGYDPIQGMVS